MNLPPTCGENLQVLDQMASKKNFIFSTDCYLKDSIKTQERLKRSSSDKFIIDGPATRSPADFKLFLANEENKMQLCQLLFRVWGSKGAASRHANCGTAVVVVEGIAHQLNAASGDVSTFHCITLYSSNGIFIYVICILKHLTLTILITISEVQ